MALCRFVWVNIIIINAPKALFRLETLAILNRVNFSPTIRDSSIIHQFTYIPILNY